MIVIINTICPHCGKDTFSSVYETEQGSATDVWKKEKELERKLDEEMPPIKFKKGNPFLGN